MTQGETSSTEAIAALRDRWRSPEGERVWRELHRLGFLDAEQALDLRELQRAITVVQAPLGDAYKVDLRGIGRRGQTIENGYIEHADLSFACFDNSTFAKTGPINGVYFSNSRGLHASFVAAQFEGWSDFHGAELNGADFSRARFEELHAQGASMQHARFVEADIQAADFQFSDLTGADFTGARIRNVQFGAAEPERLDWKPLHWADFRSFVDAVSDAGVTARSWALALGRCQPPDSDDRLSSRGHRQLPAYRWLGFFDTQDGQQLWQPATGARLLHELNARCDSAFPLPPLESGPRDTRAHLTAEELLPVAIITGEKLSIARTLAEWRDIYVQFGVDWDALYPQLEERQ